MVVNMKVLLVNKFHYIKGGSERYYFTLANALTTCGHEVIFFSMHDSKNFDCPQSKYFVSNVGVNSNIKGKIKLLKNLVYSREAFKKMDELLKAEKPDLAILNLIHKQLTCSIIDALKENGVKIFWTVHDLITVCPAYTMLNGKGEICEKCLGGNFINCIKYKCVHNSKIMSVLSAYEAMKIKKKSWYNDVDLYICPSKFYLKKLNQATFTKSKIVYKKNPLPIDTKYEMNTQYSNYFLYFGRLTREKGILSLVKAMKKIDFDLLIIGTGPLEKELTEYIELNNLNDKIHLLGFMGGEKLRNYIRESKAVILPSEWYENGPYSIMESMALSKPLIVSNNGGLVELVEDGVNGFIYRNGIDLEKALKKMISISEDIYFKMCLSSLNKAKLFFNPIKYVDFLIKMFEECRKNENN